MLNHFSHSELACPTTGELRLASGFGEALERLRVELDEPIYLNSACRSPAQFDLTATTTNVRNDEAPAIY